MTETLTRLYAIFTHAQTSWLIKLLLFLLLAYIISPIDIIPDFIPVIGLVDEIILVPVLLGVIYKLVPNHIKQEVTSREIDSQTRQKLVITGISISFCCWMVMVFIVWYVVSVI